MPGLSFGAIWIVNNWKDCTLYIALFLGLRPQCQVTWHNFTEWTGDGENRDCCDEERRIRYKTQCVLTSHKLIWGNQLVWYCYSVQFVSARRFLPRSRQSSEDNFLVKNFVTLKNFCLFEKRLLLWKTMLLWKFVAVSEIACPIENLLSFHK